MGEENNLRCIEKSIVDSNQNTIYIKLDDIKQDKIIISWGAYMA